MANANAPFGFADSHRLGAAVNYQMSRRWILATNPTPIFTGDPVVMNAGYIQQAAPGSLPATGVSGIFLGCEYMSISQKKWIANAWWPGNDAVQSGSGFDVIAKIIDDPLTVFRVQANSPSAPIGAAMLGLNATFVIGTGNTVTGKSGAMLDIVTAPALTAAFPFKIVDLVRDPPGSQGADPTTPYNWGYVTFNNQEYKSLPG